MRNLRIAIAVAAFLVATLLFTGAIALKTDPVGRTIYGTTWVILGVVWLGMTRPKRKDRIP